MPARRPRRRDRYVRLLPPSGKSYTDLDDGDYTFQVRAIDAVSNPDPSPATRSFTVDTAPPDTTINSGPTGLTRDDDPTFTFSSEAGASFECRLDGPGAATGTFASCSNPKSYSDLADGNYTFRVRAIDANSNTDQTPATRSFTVDTTAPKTTIDSGPTGTTSDTTPTFTFSSDESGSTFQCRIDNAPFGACSGPGKSHTPAPRRRSSHLRGPGHRPRIERRRLPGDPALRRRFLAAA